MESRRVAAIVLMVAPFVAAVASGQAVDISGTWRFAVDMGSAQGAPTFVLTQRGAALTGTVTNGQGEQKVTGTVNGREAVFGFATTRGAKPFKATYRATIESSRRMTGDVTFSGALTGTGTWVATKQ